MCAIRRRVVSGLIAAMLANGSVLAADTPFTGVFQGHGRQCYGKLFVRSKTIAWHTPFATCKKTRYEVIKKNLNTVKPEIIFLLKTEKLCGFGVITLDWDPDYPEYWNATGYRSLKSYEQKSNDRLNCSVKKLDK